jgi:hypothetical protein
MNIPPDDVPSLTSQAKNLAGAIGRVGAAAATGGRVLVSNDEVAARIAICESNECGAFNRQKRACNWCGCFINQKAKFATEICGEAEFAKHNNKTGYNWWTGETVKPSTATTPITKTAPVAPTQSSTQQPTHTPDPIKPQVEVNTSSLYVTGKQLLEYEVQLRAILPTNGETVKRFNEYHQAINSPTGCTSCRRNGFLRAIELAIHNDFVNEGTKLVEKVKDVFPQSKYISAPSPTTWDTLLKRTP